MFDLLLKAACLTLFDGEGGAGAASAPAEGAAGTEAGTPGGMVRYGKQPEQATEQDTPLDAGEENAGEKAKALKDRRKEYKALVHGEFKEQYEADMQRVLNKKFAETKELEGRLAKSQEVLGLLAQRYGVDAGDTDGLSRALEADRVLWESAAEEAGMGVDQYLRMQALERERQMLLQQQKLMRGQQAAREQMQQWYSEGEAIKAQYPAFDLSQETQDPQFIRLLESGVPMKLAYEVIHMNDIKTAAETNAAKQAEQNVVKNIRAKGARPPENAAAGSSAFLVKDDVSKLTKQDRAEIARRTARGEKIVF